MAWRRILEWCACWSYMAKTVVTCKMFSYPKGFFQYNHKGGYPCWTSQLVTLLSLFRDSFITWGWTKWRSGTCWSTRYDSGWHRQCCRTTYVLGLSRDVTNCILRHRLGRRDVLGCHLGGLHGRLGEGEQMIGENGRFIALLNVLLALYFLLLNLYMIQNYNWPLTPRSACISASGTKHSYIHVFWYSFL